MTPPPDLRSLDSPEKDALIVALIARIDALVAENTALRTRLTELEAKHGLPPEKPNNSSTPPSQGRKASDDAASKPKGKPHAGAHRPLHPNPTARRDMMATACQHCGANVSSKVENPFVHLILCSFIANRLRAALRCALMQATEKNPTISAPDGCIDCATIHTSTRALARLDGALG